MKIIRTDNFDRESVSEYVVAENLSPFWGETILRVMIENLTSDNEPDWFKLVEDDYQLYEFDPNA